MYNLRTIALKEGAPHNQELGDHYIFVDYDNDPEEFEQTLKISGTGLTEKEIHGFVVCERGSKIIPLFRRQKAYVIKDTGVTYENLTHHSDRT